MKTVATVNNVSIATGGSETRSLLFCYSPDTKLFTVHRLSSMDQQTTLYNAYKAKFNASKIPETSYRRLIARYSTLGFDESLLPENNKVFDYNNFLTGYTGSELYSSLKWDNMEQPLSGEYSFSLVNAADNITYTNDDVKIDSGTGVITIKNHKNITSPQLKVKVTDNVLDLSYTSTKAFSVNIQGQTAMRIWLSNKNAS